MTPVYQASTLVLVNEAPGNKSIDLSTLQTSERLAKTYAEILTTRPIINGVMARLKLDVPIEQLQEQIKVQPLRDTQLIQVLVEDTNPALAAAIANALYTEFDEQNRALQSSRYASSKYNLEGQLAQLDKQIQDTSAQLDGLDRNSQAERDRLETLRTRYQETYSNLLQKYEDIRLAEAQTTSTVVQMESAVLPVEPVRPRLLTNAILAAVVGLMLGIGIAFLKEALDDTLGSPDDVVRELNLPIMGLIARHAQSDASPISAVHPRSPVSEAFRALRTNIQFAQAAHPDDRPLRTLLITSPSPEDGKTTVAANLGVIMAQSGRTALLIDADLRRPRIHTFFGLPNKIGISSIFTHPQVILNGNLQKTDVANLLALTSGWLPPNPAELLGSEKMDRILEQVRGQSDMIIIDSPPVLAVTDAAVLAPRMDGVLLVVRPGVTKLVACKRAVEQLRRVGANVLGVVLNEVEIKRTRGKYDYYHGYYYAYEPYGGDNAEKALTPAAPGKNRRW
jgi:non-specific protein-tyrosine kinase